MLSRTVRSLSLGSVQNFPPNYSVDVASRDTDRFPLLRPPPERRRAESGIARLVARAHRVSLVLTGFEAYPCGPWCGLCVMVLPGADGAEPRSCLRLGDVLFWPNTMSSTYALNSSRGPPATKGDACDAETAVLFNDIQRFCFVTIPTPSVRMREDKSDPAYVISWLLLVQCLQIQTVVLRYAGRHESSFRTNLQQ